jgi:hypothetical protein
MGSSLRLKLAGVQCVDQLGHDQRTGPGHRSGLGDTVDGREDGLEEGRGRGISDAGPRLQTPLLVLALAGHHPARPAPLGRGLRSRSLGGGLGCGGRRFGLALGGGGSLGGGGGGSGTAVGNVDVHADDGDVPVGALPHHVHLHGAAGAVVEVLAGQVEVELLQGELRAPDRHGAQALGRHHLHRGAEVLELGALGHVGDLQVDITGRDQGELAIDHVDGGLASAGGAENVCRVESYPVGWALPWATLVLWCGGFLEMDEWNLRWCLRTRRC